MISLTKAVLLLLLFSVAGAMQAPTKSERGGRVSFALTGDSIITQRLSVYDEPEFLKMIEAIRASDVAFTNLEMLLHNFEGSPAAQSGGTYMAADPAMAKELQWAGFDLVSRANNHAVDYGVEGLLMTSKALDAVGLTHAGVGENLARARAPAYLDTRKGRVALISCASTFPAFGLAGEQRPDIKGRPGLNPLRFTTTYVVDRQSLDALKKMAGDLKLPVGNRADEIRFLNATFREGKEPTVVTEPHAGDLQAIVASIKEARRQADWVIVSIHAHEGQPGNRELPAQFVVTFARAAIEAGADIFVGHGPHVLRAIEIYKGKPIFYSLANFIFQNETVRFLPAEMYEQYGVSSQGWPADVYDARSGNDRRSFPADKLNWESVVAKVVFNSERVLEQIELHPISLGFGESRTRRGRPMLADAALGKTIIERLASLSAPVGTEITYSGGIGVVKPKP
jgi:poly-gamma-glutamate synthesis protein (capsule biosynthesis protein)